jgi:hypothetical protein
MIALAPAANPDATEDSAPTLERWRSWLIEALGRRARPLPVAPTHAFQSSPKPAMPYRLTFSRHALEELGELRFTTVEGGTIAMFALMLFPYSDEVPIFASEIVVFGSRIRVAVADIQSPTPGAPLPSFLAAGMKELAEDYPWLQATGPLPDWCVAHFTPNALYGVGLEPETMPLIETAYARLAQLYAEGIGHIRLPEAPAGPASLHYRAHHAEYTPGRPFMQKVFGEAWTEDFLTNGMYGPGAALLQQVH